MNSFISFLICFINRLYWEFWDSTVTLKEFMEWEQGCFLADLTS